MFRSSTRSSLGVRLRLLTALVCATSAYGALAQPAPAVGHAPDLRWQTTLEAFAAADRQKTPQTGGVVFVGSSSIRLWSDLESSFASQPVVIKRGFGGSRLLDCVELVHPLVLSYQPRLVVVYAGENDLAEGSTPQQVLERFQAFVQKIKGALPDSRIAFISIKPSPSRVALIPTVRETNALVHAYSQTEPRLDYIDVFSDMLDAEGQPRGELFAADRLHLNAEGYALWKKLITARLWPQGRATGEGATPLAPRPVESQAPPAPRGDHAQG